MPASKSANPAPAPATATSRNPRRGDSRVALSAKRTQHFTKQPQVLTRFTLACVLALGAGCPQAGPPPQANPLHLSATQAQVAWLRDGQLQLRTLDRSGAEAKTSVPEAEPRVPLGSLWKLLVYVYLAQSTTQEAPYQCRAQRQPDDAYCCEPGASIGRDAALAQSCAAYFAPARLGVSAAQWQAFWQSLKTTTIPPWLLELKQLQAGREVPLSQLLQVLALTPPPVRQQARQALLGTAVTGYGREALAELGSGIRYKTFSWHQADGQPLGGAAGWLPDGTPFWFAARGSSRSALREWGALLASNLPAPRWPQANAQDADCVEVDFFTRYPLRAVWPESTKNAIRPGTLNGRYRLEFANGNWLSIEARGEMRLQTNAKGQPVINARLPLNDYLARVIEREGSAEPVAAARALGVVARTYLLQNAHFEAACWHIADSSASMRVGPNPPSDAALAASWFTDGMILSGASVHFHQSRAAPDQLAWRDAVVQAKTDDFATILQRSFAKASLSTLARQSQCARLPEAENWLRRASRQWQRQLQREAGFEAPESADSPLQVCALQDGNPYSDQRRLRIWVRGWQSQNDRVTLAHEYLHLALRFHPNGSNEAYVERLARRLIEG